MQSVNQTAIVTGGATGIGRSITELFLANGRSVVMAGRRAAILNETRASILSQHPGFEPHLAAIPADVSKAPDVENLFARTIETFGEINTLINNAGGWKQAPISEINEEDIDAAYEQNIKTTILMTAAASRHLSQEGTVVNIGSFAGILPQKGASLYAAFKSACINFTRSSAAELADRNIRVNCIIPGVHRTDMTSDYIDQNQDRLLQPITLNRIGTTQDIAEGALFLTSPTSSYITGAVIEITGGKYLVQS